MITVEEARAAAATRLRRRMGEWSGRVVRGEDLAAEGYALGLKPPTEAQALTDREAAQAWVRSWREADGVRGCAVDWEERAWSRLARQTVPVRVRFADPSALAEFVGGADRAAWRRLASRAGAIRERFLGGTGGLGGGEFESGGLGDAEYGDGCLGDGGLGGGSRVDPEERSSVLASVVRGNRAAVAGVDDEEFGRVLDAAEWLVRNPQERMRPRQLPLRGVDSKWFRSHRKLVSELFRALTGGRELEILDPEDRVRLRILGRDAVAGHKLGGHGLGGHGLGGLTDFSAPAEQVANLPLRPRAVIVSENLETMLALPAWDGVVAIHGSGYAVSVVGELPWLREVPILYWGDLDSHGFAILHRLRVTLGREDVTSVLMDEDTLMEHRDLWVREEKPHRGTFDELTGREQRALARVRAEGDVRLEQERIPWEAALAALRQAMHAVRGG